MNTRTPKIETLVGLYRAAQDARTRAETAHANIVASIVRHGFTEAEIAHEAKRRTKTPAN